MARKDGVFGQVPAGSGGEGAVFGEDLDNWRGIWEESICVAFWGIDGVRFGLRAVILGVGIGIKNTARAIYGLCSSPGNPKLCVNCSWDWQILIEGDKFLMLFVCIIWVSSIISLMNSIIPPTGSLAPC